MVNTSLATKLSPACTSRTDTSRVITRSSASLAPVSGLSPHVDRRLVLLGWGAAVLQRQLQPLRLSHEPIQQITSTRPLYSLAYLDPSICISAALPKEYYLEKLRTSSRLARQQLGDLLEREAYSGLSNALVLEAFNDMRQAAFYLPCSLAHDSMEVANKAQSDYNSFLKQCRQLDTVARAAANARADHEDVESAMAMVWMAADEMMQLCQ